MVASRYNFRARQTGIPSIILQRFFWKVVKPKRDFVKITSTKRHKLYSKRYEDWNSS